MHHPAWELVATQIDHEECAPSQAGLQMPVTGHGERGHTLLHSCLTVVLHVGMVEMVKQRCNILTPLDVCSHRPSNGVHDSGRQSP
jgi:hypothetical protein